MASQGKRARTEAVQLFQDEDMPSQADEMDSLLEMIDQPHRIGTKCAMP